MNDKRILVVDDETDLLEMVKSISSSTTRIYTNIDGFVWRGSLKNV